MNAVDNVSSKRALFSSEPHHDELHKLSESVCPVGMSVCCMLLGMKGN